MYPIHIYLTQHWIQYITITMMIMNIGHCIICMDKTINDPVITMDGNVYCEKCTKHTNDMSIQQSIRCPLFDQIHTITQIRTDLNLYRIINDPQIQCTDIYESKRIMKMIKKENKYLLDDEERRHDIPESSVMKKLFEKQSLIESLLTHIDEKWTDSYGWTLYHYIGAYGSYATIICTLTYLSKKHHNQSDMIHRILLLETLFGHSVIYFIFSNQNMNLSLGQWAGLYCAVTDLMDLDKVDNMTKKFLCTDKSSLDPSIQKSMIKKNISHGDKSMIGIALSDSNNLSSYDQLEIIQSLIEQGMDFNTSDEYGLPIHGSPIHWSPINGSPIHGSPIHGSPIHRLFGTCNKLYSNDQLTVIKMLIDSGIDLEIMDDDQWRPIHYVCSNKNKMIPPDQLKAIKYMVDHGVNLEVMAKDQWRPIHFICSDENKMNSGDRLRVIRHMIDKDVNLEVMDNNHWRPIHYVCSKEAKFDSSYQLEAIKTLIAKQVDLNAANNNYSKSRPIHFVCSDDNNMNSSDQLEAIKLLVDHGVDLEAMDLNLWRPIHYVSSSVNHLTRKDQVDAIKYIVQKGVDLNVLNDDVMGPIHFVCGYDNNMGDSYMQYETICLFVNAGIDLELMDANLMRPIHYVLEHSVMNYKRLKKIVKLFLNNHIDINVCTIQGDNLMDCLRKNEILEGNEKKKIAKYFDMTYENSDDD
jgi:ankyrin repeat protein